MRKIFPVIILLLIASEIFSKCGSGGLTFWPSKPSIAANSNFLIQGYATSQKIISGLGTTYKVFLKSGNRKIKLNVQEILVGQFSVTQAIMKPDTILIVGQEYELIVENLEESEDEIFRFNHVTRKKEKVIWTVNEKSDLNAPVWAKAPEYKEGSRMEYGCGPSVHAFFSFSASDQFELLIKTKVKNAATGLIITFYLFNEEGIISVGHGMCSGPFYLSGSNDFEVEFTLVDASGNHSESSEEIKFKRPT